MGRLLSVAAAWRLRPVGSANYGRAGALWEHDPDILRWRFVQRMSRLGGVLAVLSLIPALAASSDDEQQNARSDWSRIETIAPGVRTKVSFLESGSPRPVDIKGRFSSFSDTSIVLVLNDGTTRSIRKESVRAVRTRRPFMKRRIGWIVGGAAAALSCALATCDADITAAFIPIFTAAYAGPAGLAACLLAPPRLVYRSRTGDD